MFVDVIPYACERAVASVEDAKLGSEPEEAWQLAQRFFNNGHGPLIVPP